MKRSSYFCSGLFLLLALFWVCPTYAFDTVYLKSGRILRGKVTEGDAEKGGEFIRIRTESGAIYILDKGDIVKSIIKEEQVDKDYEIKRRRIRNIATDHIELAKWCEKQDRGKTRFKEQIRWHYENVVRLDPEHDTARKKLGYMKLDNGTWVAEREFMARQGYLPDRRLDWVAELSRKVAANEEFVDSELGAKKKEFNMWLKRISARNMMPVELAKICDHSTIMLVYQSLIKRSGNPELARVHLDAISTVKSELAIRILVQFAMMATDQDVREHAISLLSQRESDHVIAVLALNEGLKSSSRWVVQNAAFAIAEIASTDDYSRDHAILPLADALITEHTENIAGALKSGELDTSFGNGGSGFRTGGGPQTRQVEYRNQQSLDALRRLCEADFQFNEQAWKNWYIENYTLTDLNVRVDH